MKRLLCSILLLALGAFAAPAFAATTVTAATTLTWTAVTTGTQNGTSVPITGVTYNVWSSVVPSTGTCATSGMTQAATGLTALTDTLTQSGLTPGSLLCYAVTATAGGQTGSFSNIVSVVVPSPPPVIPGQPTQVTATVVFVSSP